MKSVGEHGVEFGKTSPKLGRPIPSNRRGRDWGLLLGRSGRSNLKK